MIPEPTEIVAQPELMDFWNVHHEENPRPTRLKCPFIARDGLGWITNFSYIEEGRSQRREDAYVNESFGQSLGRAVQGVILELLPMRPWPDAPAARIIPDAEWTLSEAEMRAIMVSTDRSEEQEDQLNRPVIVMNAEGNYKAGDRPDDFCTNRNSARIWSTYGNTTDNNDEYMYELLPLSALEIPEVVDTPATAPPAPVRRVPDAIAEFPKSELQDRYEGGDYDDDNNDEEDVMHFPMIHRHSDGRWLSNNGRPHIYTGDRERAHVFDCYGSTPSSFPEGMVVEVLPKSGCPIPSWATKALDPKSRGKVSLIKLKFTPDFIRMLEQAPKNEMVRGWILKVTKQLPPEDCDTVEKIEEWLWSIQPPPPPPPPPPKPDFVLKATRKQDYYGRVRFRVKREAEVTVPLKGNHLAEDIMEAIMKGNTIDAILDDLKGNIEDEVYECHPHDGEWKEQGDKELGEIANGDCENEEFDYDKNTVNEQFKQWIKTNLPEEAKKLGL